MRRTAIAPSKRIGARRAHGGKHCGACCAYAVSGIGKGNGWAVIGAGVVARLYVNACSSSTASGIGSGNGVSTCGGNGGGGITAQAMAPSVGAACARTRSGKRNRTSIA